MKSLLSFFLITGSAVIAGSSLHNLSNTPIPGGTSFFTFTLDGKPFTATVSDSLLAVQFTYIDSKHAVPAALFVHAAAKANNNSSYFYIHPLNDDAPAAKLGAGNNLYKDFYITYKAPDNIFYNSTNAPGKFEITAIATLQKAITGKLNCILYSSTKKTG